MPKMISPSLLSALLASALIALAAGQSVEKKIIRPPSPNPPASQTAAPRPGVISPGVMVGDTLYLAGQGSRDPKTGQHPEGFEAQVKQVMENLGAVLKAANLDFSHVVKANVYLTDIKNFARMNDVYRTYFKSDPPARTTIAVPALPGGSQVEITFIASRAGKKIIRPEGIKPLLNAPYSPAVMVGDTLYLAGQGSLNPKTGQLVEGGIEAHVKQTLENLNATLKAAGLDASNVVSANVYLTDMANFEKMNEVYRGFFKSDPPARTTIGVSALPGDTPVEITFLASRAARKIIKPDGVRPSPNYSQAVQVGSALYLAGKVGTSEGIETQVKEAMDGLGAVLKAAGKDFSDVVEAKVYLTDISDYAKMNEVYRSYLKGDPPARTCIAVPKLVGSAKVEITFVTAAGQVR